MPRIIETGAKSKNPGKKYLQYDPKVKGDLSPTAQKLYDTALASYRDHQKLEAAFVNQMKAELKAAGTTAEIVVMLRYGKVTIDIADGSGRRGASAVVPADIATIGDLASALA